MIAFGFDKINVPSMHSCDVCGEDFMPREIVPHLKHGSSSLGYICPRCVVKGPGLLAEDIREKADRLMRRAERLREVAKDLESMEAWPYDRKSALAVNLAESYLAEKDFAKKEWAFLEK